MDTDGDGDDGARCHINNPPLTSQNRALTPINIIHNSALAGYYVQIVPCLMLARKHYGPGISHTVFNPI